LRERTVLFNEHAFSMREFAGQREQEQERLEVVVVE